MRKPEGYDVSAAYTGESQALPAGGYVCRIIKAVETESSTHRPMLAILFDIAEGEYAGYYQQQFDNNKKNNPDAKWNGVFRQPTDGKSLPFFKGMVTSIEVSNNFTWDFDEAKLKGKLFGGLFGREQYIDGNGNPRWSTKCKAVRSVETIRSGKFDIPEAKPLSASAAGGNGYTVLETISDDDLPF